MSPKLSIIILSYHNPALLRLCLKSLAKALTATPISYEIIVVDNASTYETRSVIEEEFVAAFQSIRLMPVTENAGYTRGVNIGLRAARGEYLLSLNQDIVVPTGSLEKLVEFAQQHPDAGLIGPELLHFNGSHQDSFFRFYSPITIFYRRIEHLPFANKILGDFLMRDCDTTKIQYPDWVSGAAFLVHQKALKCVGYLDEQFFHYFSDVDWSRRFWDNGYRVAYFPGAQLYHYLGRSSKGHFLLADIFLNTTTRWHIADAVRYFWRYGFFRSAHRVHTYATAH